MVLQVLLSVESDLFRLYLPVLHIHLIPAQYNGDPLAHSTCTAPVSTRTCHRDQGNVADLKRNVPKSLLRAARTAITQLLTMEFL